MFGSASRQGSSRRLIAAFVLLLLLPAAAVVWLGVRLVIQDQQLESDQLRKQRESAAERIVAELNVRLADAERTLTSTEPPGDDAVRVVLRGDGIETRPSTRLLYYPGLRAGDPSSPEFSPGETLEYERTDLEAAEAAFRKLATHRSPDIRAGAMVRIARVLRKKGRREDALRLYDELARLTPVRIDGVPADLVARRARCRTLEELNNTAALHTEATALRDRLAAGIWEIDGGTFAQYEDEIAGWLGSTATLPAAQEGMTEAVAWLSERRGSNGRQTLQFAGTDWTLLWRPDGSQTYALVAGPAFRKHQWLSAIRHASGDDGLDVALASPAAKMTGAVTEHRDSTFRQTSSQTGLPWDVVVTTNASSSSIATNRRVAILFGLGFLVLLVITGGYVTVRAVSRELAVARLQSDFVASVSHEFRTPLTSLRQFTDLLNDGGDLPLDKRQQFYAAQSRATERLQRLVESLLDFRRMQAGAHPYQRRRLAVRSLVSGVVNDFRAEVAVRGFDVEYAGASDDRAIEADPEALSLALWNLLDNAVKYSGDSRQVVVSTAARNGSIEIRVRDHGLGVPRTEQNDIFRQFVRGRDARTQSIKGTGIGLAIVQQIVRGHGGRVALESAPGEGSTFTIVLPAAD